MTGGCDKWIEAITRFVDGELNASERAALESHLERCERCRGEVTARRDARTQWREAVSLPSDAADRATIVEMARAHLKGTPWWRRWLQARSWEALVAGVSLAAVVTLVVLLSQWRTDPRSTWAPSSPAEYYVDEQADVGRKEMPRPF